MVDIHDNAEFYKELDRLRDVFRKELAARQQGQPGLGFPEELQIVVDRLDLVAKQAALTPLPPESQRHADVGSILRILVDAWSYYDPLANDLMDLCQYYLHTLA